MVVMEICVYFTVKCALCSFYFNVHQNAACFWWPGSAWARWGAYTLYEWLFHVKLGFRTNIFIDYLEGSIIRF